MTETAIPWVLVPRELTGKMAAARRSSTFAYEEMLSAVPPIPRDVWEAMVERAKEALWIDGKYQGVDATLRAALGQKVEGDE